MAPTNTEIKLMKLMQKPLMLKDYLLDDLSSCSSNGFQSFPRRQCYTTVRFLIEIDLKNKPSSSPYKKKPLRSNSTTSVSTFQRVSSTVINAVKLLPFATSKPPLKQNKAKKTITLARSLSRKLLRRSFWKTTDHKENKRWKSFRELLGEKDEASGSPHFSSCTTTTTTKSSSNSNSWSDCDFTGSDFYLRSSSGYPEVNSCDNDVVVMNKKGQPAEKAVSKSVGVAVGDGSLGSTRNPTKSSVVQNAKNESSNEGKEQFSPVSVMDFPFHEGEVSSPVQRKLMQKIRRLDQCIAELPPVKLEKLLALSDFDEAVESPARCYLDIEKDKKEEEFQIEQIAHQLLTQMKAMIQMNNTLMFKADKLIMDFFKEKIIQRLHELSNNRISIECELLDVAKGWINGQQRDLFLEWTVPPNTLAYLTDMERGRIWTNSGEENQEVALELEVEVFTTMLDEIFLDLIRS